MITVVDNPLFRVCHICSPLTHIIELRHTKSHNFVGQRLFVIKFHIPKWPNPKSSFQLLPTLDICLTESVIWKYYATKCRGKILRGTLWKFNKQKRASSRQKVPGRKISAQKLSEVRSGDIGLAPAPFSNPGTPNLSHGNNMKSWPVFMTAKKQVWLFC